MIEKMGIICGMLGVLILGVLYAIFLFCGISAFTTGVC